MRVFAVSDIHTDHPANLAVIEGLSAAEHSGDAVIVAGDVATSPQVLRRTLAHLAAAFEECFFVCGNHDLWLTKAGADGDGAAADSVARHAEVMRLCEELGVHTRPKLLGGSAPLWVAPVHSWYHESFDTEGPLRAPPGSVLKRQPRAARDVISDYSACRWPESTDPARPGDPGGMGVARRLDALNDEALDALETVLELEEHAVPLLTFSHFLPRIELVPEKRFLFQPSLHAACGSTLVESRVRSLGSRLHVFGHTHFDLDLEIDGVRYVQRALAYPQERERGRIFNNLAAEKTHLALLWDTEGGGEQPPTDSYWTRWYRANKRDPTSCRMAEYVRTAYCPDAPVEDLPGPEKALDEGERAALDANMGRQVRRIR